MSKPQYKYIYSNPRFKNKNDHDNCAGHQFEIAPKKKLSSNGLCGELIQFVKGKETLQRCAHTINRQG